MPIITDLAYAQQLDADDPLAHFRHQFVFDDSELIYLDGNSLGRLPKASCDLSLDLIQRQWGQRLIRSWNEGWIDAPQRLGGLLAPLIGAQRQEVIVGDTTSTHRFHVRVARRCSIRPSAWPTALSDPAPERALTLSGPRAV